MATVIAITSGKGGVGKTNTATNLGLALAARNTKVCVFDADTGLANINILLAINPQYTIEHVLNGHKQISDIIVETPQGLSVVPAASGIQRCTNLNAKQRQILINSLKQLESRFDFILIDTAAGIDSSVLDFVASAQYRIVVITPEPTSLTDSFALLKLLTVRGGKRNIYALINRVENYRNSQQVYNRFQVAVQKYLKVKINYLGYLENDLALEHAVRNQIPVVIDAPESSVSCCYFALADIVKGQFLNEKNLPYFSYYWQKITEAKSRRNKTKLALNLNAQTGDDQSLAQITSSLINRDYPEKEMHRMILILNAFYKNKYGKSLKNPESIVTELWSSIKDDEDKAYSLIKNLANSYERQFQKKIDDPVKLMQEKMQNVDYSKQEFSELMAQFSRIYQDRFGVEYFGDGEQLLNQIAQLLKNK